MNGFAPTRLTTKLAWRQLLRTRGSSMLVAALIAVPVAGAVGVLTFIESRTPSAEQAVSLELGQAQSWIQIAGGADPSRRQAVDVPWLTTMDRTDDGAPANPDLPPPNGLTDAALPSGVETIMISEGDERMSTRDGVAGFRVVYGDAWDSRLAGRFEVVSGQTPKAADEGMASPWLLERLGVQVGEDVELTDQGRSIRIVGVMQALDGGFSEQLFLPAAAADATGATVPWDTTWFLPDWQPDLSELADLNHAGYVAYARDLVLDPPAAAATSDIMSPRESGWLQLVLVTLGLVFGGLLVGLLAAAAMAVSTRRQQRSLAVVSTVGARHADVFRIVLTQGGLLGLAGGIIGSTFAVGAVALAFALLDPGVKRTFWSSWGLKVPWLVVGIVAFAVLVGLAASAVPARGATRGDALAALRGARRPVVMSRRQPVWGIVILLIGGAFVAAGGAIFGFLTARDDWNDGLQRTAMWASIIGVLILLLGVMLTGQGVLAAVARLLTRLGSAARLASRDAFANSPRTVPAFVSIAASTAVAVFVLCAVALNGAQVVRSYSWAGPAGSVIVSSWGPGASESGSSRAPAFLSDAGPERVIPVASAPEPTVDEEGDMTGPASGIVHLGYWDAETGWMASPGTPVTVVAADDVEALTGIRLTARQSRDFSAGGAIAMLRDRVHVEGMLQRVRDDDTVRLDFWDATTMNAEEAPEPIRSVEIPVDVHVGFGSEYEVLLSAAAAEQLGIETTVSTWVGVFAEAPSPALMDRLRADAETASSDDVIFDVRAENGPDSPLAWLALVFGILAVIVIAAAAISLGLARIERHEDDATLAAVGATTRLRRRVSAWQAVIIVGVGCVIGVLLGVIGTWALTQAAPGMQLSDLPVLWLVGIAVGLPVAISLVSLLIRPPQADLTRRTAIA